MINSALPDVFTVTDVERINDMAVMILEDKRFVHCNTAATKLFSCSSKTELLSTHPFMLSPQYQACGELSVTKANYMIDIARISGQHQFTWQHKTKDNELFTVDITLQAAMWENGKKCIVGYLV